MKKLFVCALLFGLLASVPAFAQKTYVNGIDSNYPPFAYVDEKTGQPAGFDIDAMNWIAKTMGFKVVHKPVAWDGIVLALANKQIDMIASGMSITEKRRQMVDFTEPYYGVVQAVVMPKGKKINSLADLKGLTVGSQIGITGVFVLRKADVGAKIKEYDDIGLAFEDLAAGRTDAVICDDPVAKYYANKRTDFAGKFGIAYQHNNPEYFGFCVRKGRTEMLNRLNKAIAEIKADGTENKLKVEWMGTAD